MKYTLRPYQQEAVNQALWHYENYANPFVIVAPTGSGKSLIISELCHKLDRPVLILQPTKEILEQNYEKLLSYGVDDIRIYSASCNSKEIGKYTYATIGSIYKKPELFQEFKYILLDEAHLLNPRNIEGMYNKFFKAIDCRHICGLTASPYRLVHKYIREGADMYYTSSLSTINRIYPFFFKKFAYQISIQDLIEHRYLSRLEYKFYKDFDVSNIPINTTGADYDQEALELFWNDERLKKLSQIIFDIDKECKHNLIFCSSIRQATRGSEMLRAMGLNAEAISSKNNTKSRDKIISDFREGKIKHLFNCNVLSIGFDFPALDCITLARPTISLGLLYQMVGRAVRIDPCNPDKIAKIIDITRNIEKLGRIETIKVDKEPGGFRSIITTERGEITGKALYKFKIKDEKKLAHFNGKEQ